MEQWREIPGFESTYEISDIGRIRRKETGLIRKTFYGKDGYLRIILSQNNTAHQKLVHRLLALAFIPNPENKPFINHRNGIKSDLSLKNLEWVSARENIIHASETGLNPPNKGEKNGNSKLTKEQVEQIRAKYIPFKVFQKDLAREYGVAEITISRILRKKNWTLG